MTKFTIPPSIGFMGFGEAGSTIAGGLRTAGVDRSFAFDIKTRTPEFGPTIERRAVESRTTLAAKLLTPALAASLVWWGGLEGGARWAALAGGALLSAAVVLALHNYLPLRGYAIVRRRLREKLATETAKEKSSP